MTDDVVRAATAEQIAAHAAAKTPGASEPKVPQVKFASGPKKREQWVDFEWPIEIDGVLTKGVLCRRVTGEQLMDLGEQNPLELVTGLPISVLSALDGDDFQAVAEVATDFLPRSIREPLKAAQREAMKQVEQATSIGQNTPPTSHTP